MAVEFKDYYQTLGVAPGATPAAIKKAFRKLARKYHPDVAKDKHTAEAKFKEINEANEVLSDPESRRKYDQLGANWQSGGERQAPPGRGAGGTGGAGGAHEFHFEGTGFSDFFEQFFGSPSSPGGAASPFEQAGAQAHRHASVSRRGQDIQGDILITIEEALKGALRSIAVRHPNPHSGNEETATCDVRIPAGVQAGKSIRVPGKGGEGSGGGSAGDIYLRVRYAQHPDWSASGADLLGRLQLAPWEAVLGATVPVPTLEGTVSLKVPPGTQQGHQLRVRGKGLPVGAGKRGDLYVEISVQVPPTVSKDEERLWQQLAATSAYDPRPPAKADHTH